VQWTVYWNFLFFGVLRGGIDLWAFLVWIAWFVLLNYFNLYKTRIVILLLARHEFRIVRGISVVLFDAAFGLAVFVCGIWVFSLVILPLVFANSDVMLIGDLGDRLISEPLREHRFADVPAAIFKNVLLPFSITSWFFYAGMLPSAWLWLYVLSAMVAKVSVKSAGVLKFIRYFADLEEKPFQVIGYFAGLLVLAAGVAYGTIRGIIALTS
jgi:hypothetical protein